MSISFETLALAKRYTNSVVADAIGGVTSIDFRFVESLPWAGDPGVIYCVPSGGSEPDLYDEYYYVNGRFERIPGATIDLTPYATKEWVNGEGYYKKPADGIPGSDLDDALKASIAKAETALQQHQSLTAYRTAQEQDEIDNALANIKEIEVGDTEPTDPNVKLWMYQNAGQKIEIPTMEDFRNLKPATDEQVAEAVSDWLEENISGGETIAVDKSLTVEGAAADAKAVGDLKSALENGTYVTDKYVSGARNNSGNISANANRCTTEKVFQLIAGDTISIKNLDAGLRAYIAGVSENSFVYDSGWKTDEFSYTVTEETQGIYFVTFSNLSNDNILPTDIITSQVVVKNYHYLNKIDKIPILESAINDQPSETVLAKTISGGFINSDGTVDTTVRGYSICTLQDAELIESIVVSNLSGSYKYYCFYGSSDTPIGNRKSLATDTEITIPNDVSIIRICSATASINSCVVSASKYSPLHTVFSDTDDLKNLVNAETYIYPSGITNDAYINPNGGVTTGVSGYLASNYLKIPFSESQSFQIRGVINGYASCAIYNVNFEPVLVITESNREQYGGIATNRLQTFTIPYIDGMQYARMSARTAVYSELTDLWAKGNTLSGAFTRISNIETDLRTIKGNVSTAIASSKVLVLGDSISTDAYGSYPKWVTDLINSGFLPSDTINSSQHATGFVARYNSQPNDFVTRLKAIQNPETYDLVIVFGGINDYIQNIPMGSETGTDYAVSFKPAVNEFFTYLIQNFTQARLCVLLPLRTYATWTNSVGEYQQAYGDYIKQVAKSYCLPVLNLTEDSGFCPYISTFSEMWTLVPQGYQSADGVHPNQEYERRFLAPMIKHFLQGLM